jgi:S1-C subfamily serine protease
MTALDVLIALFVVLTVLRGARTGFLAGVFSLVGMILGASLGSRVAPYLLPEGESPALGAGITLISILAFAAFGEVVARTAGGALRERLSSPASTTLDGLGGAALGFALSLVLVWAVGVFALQAPLLAGLQPAVKESRILQALNERMPSNLLTRAAAELNPLPQIRGPEANVPVPDEQIASDPEVVSAGSRTVRVRGIACGYGIEGSGWVAAPDLIVTNAHVVAGETVTRVQPGGTGLPRRAEVVLFDDKNDVAILRVENLGLDPMPLAAPRVSEAAAVLGFPESGPLDIEPARTGATQPVISGDAYNQGPVERTVTSFRAYVRPGNSGGPIVNEDGEVIATVFASRANSDDSGYGIPSQIIQRRLATATELTEPASTSSCAH